MTRWIVRILAALVLLVALGLTYFMGYRRGADSQKTPERQDMERAFAESMRGVTLTGSFTVDGQETDSLRWERYTVERAEPLGGDLWVFHARLQFGDTDMSIPVPVRLLWAGDTPMVSLTDANIPGLGTFTARVLFYRDHYAGMWGNPEVSGLQFGTITRTP